MPGATFGGMAKISVSLDDELLAEIRAAAPAGNVSRWLAEAAARELRFRALRAYADEVEADSGPFTEAELAKADKWLSSATRPS